MDFRQLFKLRLVVAAMGETQRRDWWNSDVLTGMGEFLFQQGFPRSAPFAQTRAGFRVAQLACDEALAIQPTPGGPITCHLFRLTPQLEDAFENERNRWMDEPQEWEDCFQAAWGLSIWALIRGPQLRHEMLLGSAKMEKKRQLSSRYKKVNGLPDYQMHPSHQ
jgi:hypothetical protein